MNDLTGWTGCSLIQIIIQFKRQGTSSFSADLVSLQLYCMSQWVIHGGVSDVSFLHGGNIAFVFSHEKLIKLALLFIKPHE